MVTDRKKFICFGDSITSEEVTGIGTRIAQLADFELLGNFAHGNATASDWHNKNKILTKYNLNIPVDTWFADNTLSNQVYACLNELKGTENIPDIIYIAIGINDGRLEKYGDMTPVFDNCDEVFETEYSELTRIGIASALRWAAETLKREFPKAEIYIASPLQNSWTIEAGAFSDEIVLMKREIVRKVCDFCDVNYIDSYMDSGFTKEVSKKHGDGVHPDEEYRDKIAEFIVRKIRG